MIGTPSLPLHATKAVTARILGFEVLTPNLLLLESQGYRDASARLRERLCWFANEALSTPDDDGPLDLFLTKLVGELQDEAAKLRAEAEEIASCAIADLAEIVANFNDAPYDSLGRLTAAIRQTAAAYYEAFQTAVPQGLWECTIPAVSFLGDKVSLSFAPEIHLQVSTEFGTEDLSAIVFLKISPRWLDWKTIAALPRALLHEYIAHVPQGPHLGMRKHPDANDVFAEGWMDYVAHHIHRSVLEQSGLVVPLSGCLLLALTDSYHDAAERFLSARCSVEHGDPTAAARSEGAAAARNMHDLLRRLPETARRADEYFFRLSLGLNASALDSLARRRFAVEVRRCLLRASRSDILVTALREWIAGQIRLEDFWARLLG